jgi:hypothetical protein
MRKLLFSFALFMLGSTAMAQEPVSSFATVGRQEPRNWVGRGVQRSIDRVDDCIDRKLCCGYAKSHNEMGVPGFRGTKTFQFGSSCEFFTEGCRTPPPRTSARLERGSNELYGNSSNGCNSCGK